VHGSHSKKRPQNLIFGRLFDFHLLDMLEFGVTNFKSRSEFKSSVHPMFGSKPSFILIGSLFQTNETYKLIANLFVDFFRGEVIEKINLQGIDKVISLSTCENTNTISFRHYGVILKNSGTRVPDVELEEIGPSMDLVLRRNKIGSDDLRTQTLRRPKILTVGKTKNVRTTVMRDKIAKIHLPSQDLHKMEATVQKSKAIRTHGTKRKRSSEEVDSSKKQKLNQF